MPYGVEAKVYSVDGGCNLTHGEIKKLKKPCILLCPRVSINIDPFLRHGKEHPEHSRNSDT